MKKIFLPVLASGYLLSCQNHPPLNNKINDILYIQTNDFHTDQNAVLAYRHSGDGELMLAGGPYYTKGSGVSNPTQKLGPLDSDYELRISSDGKFLLTVNSGSNTIAVFSIGTDGSLEHVHGSPFASGGQTLVSIDVSGNHVFVANKSDDSMHASTQPPNYATFIIAGNGKLSPVSGAVFETTPGSSTAQNLVSRDGKFLFGVDFLGFTLMPAVGTLRSFNIGTTGLLRPVNGTPYFIPALLPGKPAGGALGLWEHPSGSALYTGFPAQGLVGIYAIDHVTGSLTFHTSIEGGKASCWIRTNKSGSRMYILNSAENSVSVYNSKDAMNPTLLQKLALKRSGPAYTLLPNGMDIKTSEDFSLAFSTS